MQVKGPIEKARQYIESHPKLSDAVIEHKGQVQMGPCITLSREAGARADTIGRRLVELFQLNYSYNNNHWAIFDKNLIEKVLQDHHLPQRLSNLMEEEKYSFVKSMMNELLGGQPAIWTLVHKTTETILQLAHMGNVILLDRGANIITSKLENSFHVRLVAPLDNRIKHLQGLYRFDKKEALEFIKREDLDRKDFLLTYFHKDINDPLNYNLTINTGLMSDDEAAHLIAGAVIKKFPELFSVED